MTYRATLTLASQALLKLAENADAETVFHELGILLDNGEGGPVKAMLVRARAEAALVVTEAEGGSQVRAAERLGISAPTMSRQLKRARSGTVPGERGTTRVRASVRGCTCGVRSRSLWQHSATCRAQDR